MSLLAILNILSVIGEYSMCLNVLILCSLILCVLCFRYWLLPKPIPGIPYNPISAQRVFGDFSTVLSGLSRKPELRKILAQHAKALESPICQIFPGLGSRPIVLLNDAREAMDVLRRDCDFDRTPQTADFLSWGMGNQQFFMPTGPEWKARRQLIQPLMTSTFLETTALPRIYASFLKLIDVWNTKMILANGRAFRAVEDVESSVLDAAFSMTFGEHAPEWIQAQPRYFESPYSSENEEGAEEIANFAPPTHDKVFNAFVKFENAVDYITSSSIPRLKGYFLGKMPTLSRIIQIKKTFITAAIKKSVSNLNQYTHGDTSWVRSAVDIVVFHEHLAAEKDMRKPLYHSPAVQEEISGFFTLDTHSTRTVLCWGLKMLSDNNSVQSRLRHALRDAFMPAVTEKRMPTESEIIKTPVAYLDAVIEEVLRIASIVMLARITRRDTVLLGHAIPKGTEVIIIDKGAGFMYPLYDVDEESRSTSSRNSTTNKRYECVDESTASKFLPERWLVPSDQCNTDEAFNRRAHPVTAFGGGGRGCYGRRLGYLRLRLFFVMMVWNFEFQRCPDRLSGYECTDGIVSVPNSCFIRLGKVPE